MNNNDDFMVKSLDQIYIMSYSKNQQVHQCMFAWFYTSCTKTQPVEKYEEKR